ncbi:MAG: PrsW family intramembrane metalloprotease [Verrucomicrobiales bacterium]|nr:PrsW family intramembrane metalloprotease [Verrucomicrobiales bacterium]
MKFSRQYFASRSRDRSFLIKTAAAIGGIGCIAGLAVSIFTVGTGLMPLVSFGDFIENPENIGQKITLPETTRDFTTVEVADQIRALSHGGLADFAFSEDGAKSVEATEAADSVQLYAENLIQNSTKIPIEEQSLLRLLAKGLLGEKAESEQSLTMLEKRLADSDSPPRFTREFAGDVLFKHRRFDESIKKFRSEGESFPDATYSRRRTLEILQQEEKFDELTDLYRSETYAGVATLHTRMMLAAKFRHWGELFKTVLEYDFLRFRPWAVSLALICAAIWFVILGQFGGLERHQIAKYIPALVCGMFSASATLFVVVVQEQIQGFVFDPEYSSPVQQAIYCIAGIGLREEFLKLLFFVPIALALRKRHDDLTALICAGMVGLGFAMQENLGYFGDEPSFTPWSRFLTANFFHVALTGIVGLSLYRVIRLRGRGWENFLLDFIMMVVAHGMYDAVIMMPLLSSYSFLATIIIYALLTYRFLDLADDLGGTNAAQAVSPLAVFVLGSALLISIVFVAACWGVPFQFAFATFLMSLAGMLPIAFIFINRFRNA